MNNSRVFELLVAWLIKKAGTSERFDVTEEEVITFIQSELNIDRVSAIVEWQEISDLFREKKIVRDGYLVQWHMFRSAFQVRRLATAEEIQSTAELYQLSTSDEIARRIRGLTGIEFEHFITTVLSRRSEYRNLTITQASRDGGIDFKGFYVPPSPHPQAPLVGQAKQVAAPISASTARDFIGALDTAGEKRVYGLLVSTAGFTEPAVQAIENSRYHIMRWDMGVLLAMSRGIVTRQIDVSFEVPDQAFWDEVIG
jgi:hypothetical protein